MAQRSKDELVAALGTARAELTLSGNALKRNANPVGALRRNIREHQPAWIGASAVIGAILTRLPRRNTEVHIDTAGKKQAKVAEAGALLGFAKIAADFAKPAISTFLRKKFGAALSGGKN